MEDNFFDLKYINYYYYELNAQLVTAMKIQRKQKTGFFFARSSKFGEIREIDHKDH